MVKVKISHNSSDPRRTNKLLELLARNEVYANRIISVSDGFIILTNSEKELYKIFNNITNKVLEENEFHPIIPLSSMPIDQY